ncbi:MAG TPA: nucleotidyltransferase [Candidatus Saccharimonadales bacterium]|jgi:hypothetical protein|nr:nucleotidyltransferase [Candidatus Saccharimonadales bacterium]
MTINQHFVQFLSKYTPTDAEKAAYSLHRQSVEAKLASSFGVQHFWETGSFSNGTGVRFHSDLDVLTSIPAASQRTNSSYMLSAIKTALEERFTTSPIYIRTPSVVVDFSGSKRVEVTPGYYKTSVDDNLVYEIPQLGGGWIKTSPWAHNKYVTGVNTSLGYKVKPLVRLMKTLKHTRNIPISSFYLELRLAKYCEGETSIIYEYDMLRMLNRLVADGLAATRDPNGITGMVSACNTDAQKQDALSKLATASTRVNNAINAEKAGRHTDALYWWKMVFDREF